MPDGLSQKDIERMRTEEPEEEHGLGFIPPTKGQITFVDPVAEEPPPEPPPEEPSAEPPPEAVVPTTDWRPDFTKESPYEDMPPEYEGYVEATFVPTEEQPLNPIEMAREAGQEVGTKEYVPPPPDVTPVAPVWEEFDPEVITRTYETPIDPETGKPTPEDPNLLHPYEVLAKLKEGGAPAGVLYAYIVEHPDAVRGAPAFSIANDLQSVLEEYSELTGKAQFNKAIELGFIPENSEYVAPTDAEEAWSYNLPIDDKAPVRYVVPKDTALFKEELDILRADYPTVYDTVMKQGTVAAFRQYGDIIACNIRFPSGNRLFKGHNASFGSLTHPFRTIGVFPIAL